MRLPVICFSLFVYLQANAQPGPLPRYNDVYQAATHNSYWVKRALANELFASGTQERLLDQLHFDHARALEIDIHKISHKPGQWAVYHTNRSKNVFYQTLPDFLKQLQQFQYSLPQHEVVTVVLELKEIFDGNFDKEHTPAGLDSILEAYIGEHLFRPRDLLKRCPGKTTLCDCVKSSPEIWPTIEELRGKFIFLILGNFHFASLGHGGLGWATYANTTNPSAFPMSSDFSVFGPKKEGKEYIPADMLSHAYEASVFQQVEKVYDTAHLAEVAKFIASGGIVRGASSFTNKEQQQRINAGFNLLQTDYPWIQLNDRGYEQPFRPKDAVRFANPEVFIEPGHRIFISADSESFWSISNHDTLSDWETLPSTTRTSPNKTYPNPAHAYGKGCLKASSEDGQSAIMVCRQVNLRQNAVIKVIITENGITTIRKSVSNNRTSGLVGDYIRMTIEQVSGNKQEASNVHIYSSSEMMKDSTGKPTPKWNMIYTARFERPLIKQGLATGEGDVLFVGTKHNGAYVDMNEFLKIR